MRRRHAGMTLIEVLMVLAIVGLVIALLLPAVRTARPAARRNQCLNQIKQLSLALQNYHEDHGGFPPAYTVDEQGAKLHSWRTLLLPYLEEEALFDRIDLTKAWDHAANAEARSVTPWTFRCPSADLGEGMTTYLALVGPGFVFSGSESTKREAVSDGVAQTLMLFDASGEHAVHWMSPEDADEAILLRHGGDSETNHPGVILGGFADGHARSISEACAPETRRALLTIAGGEDPEGF